MLLRWAKGGSIHTERLLGETSDLFLCLMLYFFRRIF
jgi:hypothetical protein